MERFFLDSFRPIGARKTTHRLSGLHHTIMIALQFLFEFKRPKKGSDNNYTHAREKEGVDVRHVKAYQNFSLTSYH